MIKKITVVLLSVGLYGQLMSIPEWTKCFKQKYTHQPLTDGQNAFIKKDVFYFDHLIFSWNAFKPQRGAISFFVRVRYTDTQQWSQWHRMAEWSEKGGKTFYGKHSDGLEYAHVRLELPGKRFADAFHIKVELSGDASLEDIKMLAVSLSRLQKFVAEDYRLYDAQKSWYIKDVPTCSQMLLNHPKNKVICSPTSLCSLVSYMMGEEYDPLMFAEGVYDHGLRVYGSWPCNMAHAFAHVDGAYSFHTERLANFNELMRYIMQDIPVVVSVRGTIIGAPKPYNNGHLLVVVGYNSKNKTVICNDPAVPHEKVVREYPLWSFLPAWEASQRLSYIVTV